MEKIVENIQAIQKKLGQAQLVAVTKTQPVEIILQALDAGVQIVGENRVQEAEQKFSIIKEKFPKVAWHLIGHLQTNKAQKAVKMFDLIHSIDSEHLLFAVSDAAKKINKIQDVLLQVNLVHEETKFGLDIADVKPLLKRSYELDFVRVCGLMFIAPNYEDVNQCTPLFQKMHQLFLELQKDDEQIKFLSMGMTNDYELALAEGANLVRIGTGIFGKRNYAK